MSKKGNFAIASWHQNCFAGILSHTKENVTILVSRSFDGEIISHASESIGIYSVRGSSSRGGREALDGLVETLHSGKSIAITVDGPRGPAHKPKAGIFSAAFRGDVAILPLAAVADRYWTFKSWDRFRLPKPFSRIYVVYGEPKKVRREDLGDQLAASSEDLAKRLADADILAHQAVLKRKKTSKNARRIEA